MPDITRWQQISYELRWLLAMWLLDCAISAAPDSAAKDTLLLGAVATIKDLGIDIDA